MSYDNDYYQACHHCGLLVNTYNEHALIIKGGIKFFLHNNCVENVNLEFNETEIIYKNSWILEENKK